MNPNSIPWPITASSNAGNLCHSVADEMPCAGLNEHSLAARACTLKAAHADQLNEQCSCLLGSASSTALYSAEPQDGPRNSGTYAVRDQERHQRPPAAGRLVPPPPPLPLPYKTARARLNARKEEQ